MWFVFVGDFFLCDIVVVVFGVFFLWIECEFYCYGFFKRYEFKWKLFCGRWYGYIFDDGCLKWVGDDICCSG